MARVCSLLLAATALAGSGGWLAELQQWRERRETSLKADGGWLTVAGLSWLREGANTFGAATDNMIVLPEGSAPARAGTFELRAGQVTAVVDGRRRVLRPDSDDALSLGRLQLSVIRRGGRYAIRLRDNESALRREFKGLRWFPPDERYRITARFVAQPRTLRIVNVLGQSEERRSPGYAEFTLEDRTLRLYPVADRPGDPLFFIFRDRTSGRETYGGGRFLYTEPPRNGAVTLDFNRAYNPPCAFTPYSTCPLPPKENRLPVRIPAGEQAYRP